MERPTQLDCVMPAAGLSSRMGNWKMMLPYQQHTILDESIENALQFCSRVILVVGYRGKELLERYQEKQNVKVVVNTNYKQGMFSSIQQGVRHVESEHFFICHGDMPCVYPEIYQKVWLARGLFTVFPGTKDKPGHPVLLPAFIKEDIRQANIEEKMKRLIYRHNVVHLGLEISEIHLDVDTPEAYKKLCCGSQ